jgi:Domain of unknown function (DUF4411)
VSRTLIPDGYSFDTCAILDLYNQYPQDVFAGLWGKVDDLITSGRLVCSDQVLRELERKDDDPYKWAKARATQLFEPVAGHWKEGQRIANRFPRLVDAKRTTPQADPFVVAHAKSRGWTVVTSEKGRTASSLPPVCRAEAVPHLNLVGVFRAEGWRFV